MTDPAVPAVPEGEDGEAERGTMTVGDTETDGREYVLSSVPSLLSMLGKQETTLLTGYEPQDDGAVRVYLGPRYQGVYLLVTDPDEQEFFRRGWATGRHVWLSPIPPSSALHQEPSS